ncbi:hypothetical protein FKM82_019644 [Ascaphus truei]
MALSCRMFVRGFIPFLFSNVDFDKSLKIWRGMFSIWISPALLLAAMILSLAEYAWSFTITSLLRFGSDGLGPSALCALSIWRS